MVDDTRVIWERVKSQAIDQIHMYTDGLIVSEEMLKLAVNKLKSISGQTVEKINH